MGRVKSFEWIFYFILIFFIIFSIFFSIPIGQGEIGISADPLAIGDRTFYIDDIDPYGLKGYQNFGKLGEDGKIVVRNNFFGGILYPKVLEIASFISEKIFGKGTTSIIWNAIVITFSTTCALLTHKLLYLTGRIIGGEETGKLCMIIYTLCPYTYYYVLCGGITNYTLLFSTLSTYSLLKIFHSQNEESLTKYTRDLTLLSISLLCLNLLRPDSAIFSFVVCIGILFKVYLQDMGKKTYTALLAKRPKAFLTIILISMIVISISELIKTRAYSMAAVEASLDYGGSFFGYPRELLKEKIHLLSSTGTLFDNLKSFSYRIIFMTIDFYAGINDVRDSFTAAGQGAILPFLARISIGIFFFMPLSTLSILGIVTFRRRILDSGFIITLVAAFLAISTSFFGCSLSKYYFMFITPFIVSAALLLNGIRLSEKFNSV